MNEEIVLCAANAYEQKFYLNPEFDALPENVKEELKIMCVLYTEDVGGILMLVFDEEGNLELKVDHEENDFFFDEIGSVLKIRELQKTKRELFESLEMFFGYSILEKMWSRIQRTEEREGAGTDIFCRGAFPFSLKN